MTARCERCDREKPTHDDFNHKGPCPPRCETLCWNGLLCDPVDWRARALKAEEVVKAAVALVAAYDAFEAAPRGAVGNALLLSDVSVATQRLRDAVKGNP